MTASNIMASVATEQAQDRVDILGIPVDRFTFDQTLEVIDRFVREKTPRIAVTADSSAIVAAQSDPEFREVLLRADLVTADSAGIRWAARRKGMPIVERVSGVDLVDALCARSADHGYRIFFLGAAAGVAEMAAEALRLKHPGCNIVGTRHGFFPAESDEVVASEIAPYRPDILFVAMGIPRQEKFIARALPIIQAPVSMGVGGSFDVFSGKVKRAPRLFQRFNLEWLWRLMLNPKKFSKVKALPKFVLAVLREES